MNKDTADLLYETLEALDKHTGRLNTLDKQSANQSKRVDSVISQLEKQIEVSTKDVLLQLLDKGNTDKEQLVKDITSAIATSIAGLTVKAGDVSVNVETDSIAKVISKLPINNTNNIIIDTTKLVEDNKQFLVAFQSIGSNMSESFTAMKLLFQEAMKKEKILEVKPVEKEASITGMTVTRNSDGMIESVAFIR